MTDTFPGAKSLVSRLLQMRVVRNMTKKGKLQRFCALVAVGTRTGGLALGQVTGNTAGQAIHKATQYAMSRLEYFPLPEPRTAKDWTGRTIWHDDIVKFKATKLHVRPATPGTGRRCHPSVAEMCHAIGIDDISAAVHGSKNKMNVAKAFMEILQRQKSPEIVAEECGIRIQKVKNVYSINPHH